MLERFEIEHKDEFGKIVELLGKELKAEVAAERARKQVLEASKDIEKNQKRKVFASDKLKDAEFLGQDATLLLVEGLSAASSIAQARDATKWGILALRGKPINTFANDDEKIYQNEEIKLLLSAMNIVPGKYDSKKLRYGRIGICSDLLLDFLLCARFTNLLRSSLRKVDYAGSVLLFTLRPMVKLRHITIVMQSLRKPKPKG